MLHCAAHAHSYDVQYKTCPESTSSLPRPRRSATRVRRPARASRSAPGCAKPPRENQPPVRKTLRHAGGTALVSRGMLGTGGRWRWSGPRARLGGDEEAHTRFEDSRARRVRVTFIETNVFLFAVGRPHPLREEALRLLDRGMRSSTEFVTSAEVLQEVLHVFFAAPTPGALRRRVRTGRTGGLGCVVAGAGGCRACPDIGRPATPSSKRAISSIWPAACGARRPISSLSTAVSPPPGRGGRDPGRSALATREPARRPATPARRAPPGSRPHAPWPGTGCSSPAGGPTSLRCLQTPC